MGLYDSTMDGHPFIRYTCLLFAILV
ncbi:hypothetical protein ACFX15_021076 [Malus domestica]